MGKFRGGRGGNRGNSNNGNGQNRNNFNNSETGGKFCKHCNRSGHTTNDCFKKPTNGPNNQNHRVDKNKHHNGKTNGKNSNGNQTHQHNRDPCTRCGLKGHDRRNCNAKEVPEDEQCDCGCEFHQSNQCPWDNDPLERDAAEAQATGKICQWCKDAGDGLHVYEDCKEPKRFQVQLFRNIQRAYDDIKWCWHCSSVSHATRGCSATSADTSQTRWRVKITDIIEQWLAQNSTSYEARYRDNDEDMAATEMRGRSTPPMPADFKWCIACEEFGHYFRGASSDCKYTEYEKRCPIQFKDQTIGTAQPFVPAGFNTTKHATTAVGTHAGLATFFHKCITPDCQAKLGPWHVPCPRFGETIVCKKCGRSNTHPSNTRKDSKTELLEMVLKLMKETNKSSSEIRKKSKRSALDNIKNPYLKRPSMALTKKLAVSKWPVRQPRYYDLTDQQDKEPVFKNSGAYFNELGNHQTYFPASKFRIDDDMIEIAKNDEMFINKAGRQGLRLQCQTCGMLAMVADEEGDHVMCGSDPMCTVGCGVGSPFWCDERGFPRERCRCITLIGQVPDLAWVTPKK